MTKRISAVLAIILAVSMILPQTAVFAATKEKAQTTLTTATVVNAEKSAIEIWAEEKYGAIRDSLEFDSDAEMLGGRTLEEFRKGLATQTTAREYWKKNGLPTDAGWTDKIAWTVYYTSYYYNRVMGSGIPLISMSREHQKLTTLFCIYDEEESYEGSLESFKTTEAGSYNEVYLIARSESGNLYVSKVIADAYCREKGYILGSINDSKGKGFNLKQADSEGLTYEISDDAYAVGDPATIQAGSTILCRWDTILKAFDTLHWYTAPKYKGNSGL